MAKIVGLTGGIGSGKTTVAKMFQELGVPVYIADWEAKKITDKPSTIKLIEEQFGNSVLESGMLNRAKLAQIVFNNPEKLAQLNAIIHPLVAKHFTEWLDENKKELFVIKEVAILFETKGNLSCDFVITVTAPLETRINRVIQRDQTSVSEIQNRINNQWSDEDKIAQSDFVIHNLELESTQQQVTQVYHDIIKSLK